MWTVSLLVPLSPSLAVIALCLLLPGAPETPVVPDDALSGTTGLHLKDLS